MPKTVFSLLISLVLTLTASSLVNLPAFAQAPVGNPTPVECDATFKNADQPQCLQSLGVVFKNVLNVIMGLAGFAAFGFLIFGGFKFLTSQGDPKALGSAKTTMTWAIAGLAMIVVSYLIILLISQYTGVTQLRGFAIPTPGKAQP